MKTKPASTNKRLYILIAICLSSAMCCSGSVLSAVVIPAFLRAIKKSKVSEPEGHLYSATQHIKNHWTKHCKMPATLPTHGKLPVGGEKVAANAKTSSLWRSTLGVRFQPELYFQYQTRYKEVDARRIYTVIAKADFVAGGPQHTMRKQFIGESKTCTLKVLPNITLDEFE